MLVTYLTLSSEILHHHNTVWMIYNVEFLSHLNSALSEMSLLVSVPGEALVISQVFPW